MKNPRFPAQAVLIEGTLQLTSYVPDTFGYACSSHQIVTTEIYQLLAKQNTKQKTRNGGGGDLLVVSVAFKNILLPDLHALYRAPHEHNRHVRKLDRKVEMLSLLCFVSYEQRISVIGT